MPVARSRPLRRLVPSSSMAPAPATPKATKPTSGLTPSTKAAEPPVDVMSAKACPANDWPLITVKTPMGAHTRATTAPTTAADWTGPLEKNPGGNTACRMLMTA